MARTAGQFVEWIKSGVGKNAPDARLQAAGGFWGILNDAGRALYIAAEAPPYNHTWTWRARPTVRLTIPADLTTIPLPDDFGAEVSCRGDRATGSGEIVMADMGRLNELAGANVGVGNNVLYICFEGGVQQESPNQSPRKVAQVWPAQAAARSDVLLSYMAEWRDLDESRSNEKPAIPPTFERLLYLMAREFAWGALNQRPAFETSEIGPELSRLVAADSRKQSTIGRPTHSVMGNAIGNRGGRYLRGGIGDITTREILRP